MLKKSTKEILLKDLLETKQILQNSFSSGRLVSKGGDTDKFFLQRALEFQRNAILYDSLLSVGGVEEDSDKVSPLEKMAIGLDDIRSLLEDRAE